MPGNVSETHKIIRTIKSNKFIEEQKLILQYINNRYDKLMDELIFSKDTTTMLKLQGAIQELHELKRILGDN
jgi:hypothetical protein